MLVLGAVLCVTLVLPFSVFMRWLTAVVIIIPSLALGWWLAEHEDEVVDRLCCRESTLRSMGLLCFACRARLHRSSEWGWFTRSVVAETGRCHRCQEAVTSDPLPVPVPDTPIPSPFATCGDNGERIKVALEGECKFSSSGMTVELISQSVAQLHISSGRIVDGDPLFLSDSPPLEIFLKPGDYSVDLLIARISQGGITQDERIALARIRITEQSAVTFKCISSYGVDNATGCFADMEVGTYLSKLGEREFGAFWKEMRAQEELVESPTRSWGSLELIPQTGDNIVFFTSGWGDGVYGTYLGFDGEGQPVSVVTDFGLLDAT